MARRVRSFLGWLLLIAIFGAIVFVAAPLVARPLVAQSVRAALPTRAGTVDVDVTVDTLHLLAGSIDQVHITGSHLENEGATVGSLDVTADNVSIGDRRFASITGTLKTVVLHRPSGVELPMDTITLSGPSSAVIADAVLGKQTVTQLVQAALADSGLAAG